MLLPGGLLPLHVVVHVAAESLLTRGGPRPRSGKPRHADEPLVSVSVLLTVEEREAMRARGPSLSAAIRAAVVEALKRRGGADD